MYTKLINIVLAAVLVVVQLGFISGLPGILSSLNIIIIMLLFVLVLGGIKMALTWSLVIGFFVDLFSFTFFGLNLISLNVAILITYFLLVGFFTNRSLYSFLTLIIVFTLSNQVMILLLSLMVYLFDGQGLFHGYNSNYFLTIAYELIINLIFSATLFQVVNYISHQFKPVFLNKSKIL